MREPDFELAGSIRAARLESRTPPETTTATENARLDRHERRRGMPRQVQPNAAYENVEIEKRFTADLHRP